MAEIIEENLGENAIIHLKAASAKRALKTG
jgi:hypothetical protein